MATVDTRKLCRNLESGYGWNAEKVRGFEAFLCEKGFYGEGVSLADIASAIKEFEELAGPENATPANTS